MTIKGPFKILPRPFAERTVIITASGERISISSGFSGPLGGPRPFARLNPGDLTEDIKECADSRGAQNFVDGIEEAVGTSLSDERKEEIKRQWCEGIIAAGEVMEVDEE